MISRKYRFMSTVEIGYNYEKQVLKVLEEYKFNLIQSGQAGDKGIDLFGKWILKNHQINVIVQCKCFQKQTPPTVIRDLMSCVDNRSIGILATPRPFSRGSILSTRIK